VAIKALRQPRMSLRARYREAIVEGYFHAFTPGETRCLDVSSPVPASACSHSRAITGVLFIKSDQ
jgi:hypothetical protein